MRKLGILALWVGVALSGAGVTLGFAALFADQDRWAMLLLGMVPFGFLSLMLGVVMTLFGRPE